MTTGDAQPRRPTDHVVPPTSGAVLVLGEFDGVHRGHVALVETAVELASRRGAQVVAVVADRGRGAPHIMAVTRRCELLLSYGVSSAVVAPLARPVDVRDALGDALDRLHPSTVFVDREAWPTLPRAPLQQYLAGLGAAVLAGPEVADADRETIEAVTIIDRLSAGDVVAARTMLGRPYELAGSVVQHDVRPPPTGFQTEELSTDADAVLPRRGVYAARALVGRRWVEAAVNIGIRPMLTSSGPVVVEAHLLDFQGDLRDSELSLRFVRRLRDERLFARPQDLAVQVRADVHEVRALLRSKT